jgi:hypothetical protein
MRPLLAALCALAFSAPAAQAAQVGLGDVPGHVTYTAATFTGAPGEANHVQVSASGPAAGHATSVTFTDESATLTAVAPCVVVSAHVARCDADVTALVADLGDGDNTLRFASGTLPMPETVTSGDGADDIASGPRAGGAEPYQFWISTGGGDDVVRLGDLSELSSFSVVDPGSLVSTGPGSDRVYAVDGKADTVSCGDGTDTVLADPFDEASADCETAAVTLNRS